VDKDDNFNIVNIIVKKQTEKIKVNKVKKTLTGFLIKLILQVVFYLYRLL